MRSASTGRSRLWRWALVACAAVTVLSAPTTARASDDEEAPRVVVDARLEGLSDGKTVLNVSDTKQLLGFGTAATWFSFILLGGIIVAVMMKDAKRSHLD